MIRIKYYKKLLLAFLVVFGLSSCGDMFDLDINQDPNNPAQVNSNLLLSSSQYALFDWLAGGANNNVMGFMGILASFDSWQIPQNQYNAFWRNMYANQIKDIQGIIEANAGEAGNPRYSGVAKVLKAYAFMMMVDLFGDVPFSQALLGNAEGEKAQLTPNFDKDSDIYPQLIALVDEAIADLQNPDGLAISGDIIYGGDAARWIKLGNTLKLRMLLNTRLVNNNAKTEIEAILNAGNYIQAGADDFVFRFSRVVTPDNRHPWYQSSYTASRNDFTYILHQYMVEMLDDADPRWPFYFKRQTREVLDQTNDSERNTTPCSQTPGCAFGYVVLNPVLVDQLYTQKGLEFNDAAKDFLAGIFGRDRGDPAGIPLDGGFRTYPGVYPAGGYFDATRNPSNGGTNVATGGGIFPAITNVNTLYYQLEAILTMGVAGDARAIFEKAIRDHIGKVVTFGLSADSRASAPPITMPDGRVLDTEEYVQLWLGRFDDATTNEAKLNVVLKQLYFSSWGNAYDLYNAFRRTGLPNTLQEPINAPRDFPLRFPYPQEELTLNPNAAAYEDVVYDRDPIFWDK